ncbi:18299_t:CDS:2 [Racocetra persica]|uniref:18299_t:CDS:1 n=1 Tax=Racocetra persica TaxID=160502 RepID=A0ACA9MHD6_9GLOM|nr:18299_t:CDS:2 [Racocetra persica]
MAAPVRTIQRKALGRGAVIGSLYDATKDIFCKTSILKTELPPNSINRIYVPNTSITYECEDSYLDKFKNLEVESQLRISVLLGLVALDGSGKYLDDIKTSCRSVKGTLVYKMTSVEETLDIYHENVKPCISMDAFNTPEATHVVIGIKWGAAVVTSFEHEDTNKEKRSQVGGELKDNLKKMLSSISAGAGVHVNVEKGSYNTINRFSIKLLGDIIPHKIPQSFEDARELLSKLPSYIKKYNNGKGVPIEYSLYPLSELSKILLQNSYIDRMIIDLSEETIQRVDRIFIDLFKSKQELNDLYNDAKSIASFIPDELFDEINKHVQEVNLEETRFRRKLSECLINIRSGKDNLNELENNIKEFQQSNLSETSITSFIKKYKSEPSKFFIVDPTICSGADRLNHPVIHHYINGRLNSSDYYNDKKKLFTSNIIKFNTLPSIKPNNHPNKNERLRVPCPRSLTDDCSCLKCEWICIRCEQYIEYGYNKHLYCECGESKIDYCKFKCSSSRHTGGYILYDQNKLVDFLPSVAPREEINILLLGETGTGKSTFINAFANYFKFNSLEDAISGELDILITSKFTITNEDYDMKLITVVSEEEDENEVIDCVGMSSTQQCGIYVFHADENKVIRLIDTPGIGDTRGIEYDKKNFENILKNISQHDHLDGICILLKPNDSRLNIIFRFCIHELLSHLHKSAKDNIVFCFTNTRGTFFCPGDTLPVLKKQLQELERKSGIEMTICKNTSYCFDNDSFRFLAAIKNGVSYSDKTKENYALSWENSVKESVRLLQYIIDRTPHKINDTISLNNARQTVMMLCEPLAEIDRNIQENIAEVNKLKKEIQKADITDEELRSKLYIPRIELKTISLERPRVTCTNIICQKQSIDISMGNCHVKWKTLNTFMLKYNGSMMFGKCKSCDCPAKSHKTNFYKSISKYSKKIDENIENKISENKINQIDKLEHIEMLQEQINQLKEQQNTVNEIAIQFTQFLMQNAIAAFNDAYVEYLDYIIHLEREKYNTFKDYNHKILEGLEEIKIKYDERVNILKKKIENNDPSSCTLSSEDIFKLEQQLYSLPSIGQYLQAIKKEEEIAFRYRERHYKLHRNVLNALTKIFKNS